METQTRSLNEKEQKTGRQADRQKVRKKENSGGSPICLTVFDINPLAKKGHELFDVEFAIFSHNILQKAVQKLCGIFD